MYDEKFRPWAYKKYGLTEWSDTRKWRDAWLSWQLQDIAKEG